MVEKVASLDLWCVCFSLFVCNYRPNYRTHNLQAIYDYNYQVISDDINFKSLVLYSSRKFTSAFLVTLRERSHDN